MQIESAPRTLLRTRLARPRLARDVVIRPRLFARLDELPLLALVVAPAGYGKTTLVNSWLQTSSLPNAWLSLSGQDLDLGGFIGYLTAAVASLFPDFGHEVLDLVAGLNLPPPQVAAQILVNEIDTLGQDFVLVLDDYHLISDTAIHGLLAELLRFPPRPLRLVMITRQDPPLALAKARAQGALVEIRATDLRFTQAEAGQLLRGELAHQADQETLEALVQGVEGWAVGLRLGALYARQHQEADALRAAAQGDSRYMMDYLADEVLATLPEGLRSFLFKTSILERLSGTFCAAVVGDAVRPADGQRMLRELEAAGIFTVALDEQGEWFQYHPVFRRLLQRQLTAKSTDDEIAELHRRAARWRWTHGFHEEATRHAFAAGDAAVAVAWLAEARPALMNQEEWLKLEHWLRLFPRAAVEAHPVLLVTEAWIRRSHFDMPGVALAVAQAETALAQARLAPAVEHGLTGELEILHTFLCYWSSDMEGVLLHGARALAQTPRELFGARALAMMFVSGAEAMRGDLSAAYKVLRRDDDDAAKFGYPYEMRRLGTLQFIQWQSGDLQGVAEGARQVLAWSREFDQPESTEAARYHLAAVCYQQDDLPAVESQLSGLASSRYRTLPQIWVQDACILALTHEAQGRPDQANETADLTLRHLNELDVGILMPTARALKAELALRRGRVDDAVFLATELQAVRLPQMPFAFIPHMALVKLYLAQNTPGSRQSARELLTRMLQLAQSTHQVPCLIEVLALLALLLQAEGAEPEAQTTLERAIALAEPRGFLRIFADLCPGLDPLLIHLARRGVSPSYIAAIRAAARPKPAQLSFVSPPALIVPAATSGSLLTFREQDVLRLLAQRLTNKEIGQELHISTETVKQHTVNIFRKLNVENRRQAIVQARAMGLL